MKRPPLTGRMRDKIDKGKVTSTLESGKPASLHKTFPLYAFRA